MTAWSRLCRRLRADRVPRALGMFFATSLAARALGIVCQLLQVPLVIRALGPEAFGFWMTLTSLTNLVQFADLGLGIGAQNRLAEQLAGHHHDEARDLFGSVFACLAGGAVVLAAGLALLVPHIDFSGWFHLRDAATLAQAPAAALAVGWIFCAGFPFGLAQRLAFARQKGWTYNVAQAAASLVALAAVAWGVHAHWSLPALAAAAQGATLLGNVALLGAQCAGLGWLDLRRFTVQPALVRGLLGLGALFSVQQILGTVLFSLPSLIIAARLGAAAVAPYNLVQRLFNLFAVVQNAFLLPLWPAYSQAKARGEFTWIQRALTHSIRATAVGCIAPMAACACFAPLIIGRWIGAGQVQPETSLVWLLCAWNALVFIQQPYLYLLVAVSEVRRTTLYSLLSAAISTLLMYALAPRLGVPGVVVGLILGFLPFNFVGNLVETRRYLRTAPGLPAAATLPAT